MAISRMQQPRQMYGLGSFVKKAVKGVTKGVKNLVKSDLGKAAILGIGAFGLPTAAGQNIFGGFLSPTNTLRNAATNLFLGKERGVIPGERTGGIYDMAKNFLGTKAGKTAGMFTLGTLGGTALAALEASGVEDPNQIRDVETLKLQLANGYKLLNPGVKQNEVDAFVQANTAEYRAEGGRIGYAMGSPEENAMQASGIMGLPLNENPAGITELDLRETGGFIPPVGVKEKEDDIPAMLSNNEFVFTADAVRGMGDGDVNKGAQRMYDMMKKLENGGRV